MFIKYKDRRINLNQVKDWSLVGDSIIANYANGTAYRTLRFDSKTIATVVANGIDLALRDGHKLFDIDGYIERLRECGLERATEELNYD